MLAALGRARVPAARSPRHALAAHRRLVRGQAGRARRRGRRRARRRRARQPQASSGTLDFSEQFRSTPESVQGLRSLKEKFPPGQAGPVDVVADAGIGSATASRSSATTGAFSRRSRRASARRPARADPRHAQPGPVHRGGDGGDPEDPRRTRAASTRRRSSAARRPRCWTPRRARPRREADRPARPRARLPDRRDPPAQPDRADLRDRDRDAVLRLRARRLRAASSPVRPRDAAVHVRLPGRAGRRLQHLPAHAHQGGARRRGRGDHRRSSAPAA